MYYTQSICMYMSKKIHDKFYLQFHFKTVTRTPVVQKQKGEKGCIIDFGNIYSLKLCRES